MGSSGTQAPLISVLLPTRHRPALVRSFLDSLTSTASEPGLVEAILYIDDDDPTGGAIDHPELSIHKVVGPQVTMGTANSACLARSSGDIVVLANDDVIVRTPGWDAAIRACHHRFPDGVYLAWPNDGFASHRISTFPVISRRLCELLENPYPDVYRRAFIDTELYDIFLRVRRLGYDRMQYLQDVTFEHHHHRTGKRPVDRTSALHLRFADDATFLGRVRDRQHRAERLVAAIESRPLPATIPAMLPQPMPQNPFAALSTFSRIFLRDSGLPLRRRLYLFVHYCGRWAAASWRRTFQLLP